MTKPIILVKICYNIVSFKVLQIFDKITSWPDIKPFGRACLFINVAPHFFTPQVFLFSISLLFVNKYHYFIEAYMQMLL